MTSYTVVYLFQLKVTRIHPGQRAGSFTDALHILHGDAAASQNMFNHILVTRIPPSVSQGCLFLKTTKDIYDQDVIKHAAAVTVLHLFSFVS